ncbi:MAG: hypothetical protein ACI4K5_01890 [Ruminococcus sp.]
MSELINILFWIARIVILTAGSGVGLIKIVKGRADENPRDFQEGLTILVGSGVVFGATFAIQKIFS